MQSYSTPAYFSRSMIENSFNIRDKQRYRQTIFEGEVTCQPTVVYAYSITVYEHKQRKFAYSVLVKSWKIL